MKAASLMRYINQLKLGSYHVANAELCNATREAGFESGRRQFCQFLRSSWSSAIYIDDSDNYDEYKYDDDNYDDD